MYGGNERGESTFHYHRTLARPKVKDMYITGGMYVPILQAALQRSRTLSYMPGQTCPLTHPTLPLRKRCGNLVLPVRSTLETLRDGTLRVV
eukprot:gene3433-biopygen12033